jgi:DnaJ-class molecular chaperone
MEISQEIKIVQVVPKYYAQECPVCHGFGTLRHGTKVCQGCAGKGFVIVPTGLDGGKYGLFRQ